MQSTLRNVYLLSRIFIKMTFTFALPYIKHSLSKSTEWWSVFLSSEWLSLWLSFNWHIVAKCCHTGCFFYISYFLSHVFLGRTIVGGGSMYSVLWRRKYYDIRDAKVVMFHWLSGNFKATLKIKCWVSINTNGMYIFFYLIFFVLNRIKGLL